MQKKMKKVIIIFFTALNFVLFSFICLSFYLSKPIKHEEVIFIPQGSLGVIITHLKKQNYDLNALDKYILSLLGQVQAGWINLGAQNLSKAEFLYKLTKAKAALIELTLIPGETSEIFLKESAKKLNLDKKKLLDEYFKQVKFSEANFYPETYKIPKGISEENFIKLLLNFGQAAHEKIALKIFGEFNEKKWQEILIIASIIQKEAANEDEMPLVASVIYNRLKKKMRLQMDGTLNYGVHSHEKITPERIKNDESSFNTYKFYGLPKSAICNVSSAAIRAAIFPAKSEFLYFVRDKKTGAHLFSTNLNTHNKNIDKQR